MALAQNDRLDFKNCSGLYRDLYDPERYKEIMQQILSELDQGIEYMLETDLPR